MKYLVLMMMCIAASGFEFYGTVQTNTNSFVYSRVKDVDEVCPRQTTCQWEWPDETLYDSLCTGNSAQCPYGVDASTKKMFDTVGEKFAVINCYKTGKPNQVCIHYNHTFEIV